MLFVFRSNHIPSLVEVLARRLDDDPSSDPMASEQIVVGHRGMERWLRHQLSEYLGGRGAGICSMVDFPFPEARIYELSDSIAGLNQTARAWSRPALTWAIAEILLESRDAPELGALGSYLDSQGSDIGPRLLAISREIAETFNRYMAYRPEYAMDWARPGSSGAGTDPALIRAAGAWQPMLWARLRERLGPSPAESIHAAIRVLEDPSQPPPQLSALRMFGISHMPPSWLHLLNALAQHTSVELYFLSPSPEYWDESRRQKPGTPQGTEPRLLRSLGRLGRDFQHLLTDLSIDEHGIFYDPVEGPQATPNALHWLQSDLRNLRDRAPRSTHPPVDARDASIQFHAAPGPIRQVEILREALLHLLSKNPSLEARDILIMSPDHERFAPLVSAVFSEGGQEGGPPRIPIQVADRGLAATNPVASDLLAILRMISGRAELSQVMELLASSVVAPRFDITEDDLGSIRTWVEGAQICWGQDKDHRAAHGQPAAPDHTWRYGLDRLLLGVAIQDPERLYMGYSAWDELEGSETEALGRFCEFCRVLFETLDAMRAPRRPTEWMSAIEDCLDRIFEVDDDHRWTIHKTRDAIEEWLCPDGQDPISSGLLSAEGLAALLGRVLDRKTSGSGHQTGKATFCAMSPMRSIPFKVIALLGMEEGVFPRSDQRCGFDLMELRSRPGDRVLSDEDRTIFLESILCASENLIITWSHTDPCTGRDMAPAVPLAELQTVMDRSFVGGSKPFIRTHPLHPYAPQSFGRSADPDLQPWSMDPSLLGAAQVLARPFVDPVPMLDSSLSAVEPRQSIDLESFIRALQCPTADLLRSRLQMRLWKEDATLLDREPLELDGLSRWSSRDDLIEGLHQGRDPERVFELQRARNLLSPGTLGRMDFDEGQHKIARVIQEASAYDSEEATQIPVDLEISGLRITGAVGSVHGDNCLRLQAGRVKAKHQLAAWVRQLCLGVVHPDRAFQSVLIWPKDNKAGLGKVILGPVGASPDARLTESRTRLEELVALFQDAGSRPVPVFPEAGLSYAAKQASSGNQQAAMKDARSKWSTDLDDVYMQHAYGTQAKLDDVAETGEFQDISDRVFGPLVSAGGKP